MGVSYKAYAVLGVKLGFNELFKPKKIKAFEHNLPEDWLVDPKTGEDLWATYPVCVLNNDEELHGEISNIRVVDDANHDRKHEHFYYFGKIASAGDYENCGSNFIADWNTDEIKKDLQELLEPHNLWFPKTFGIYAVQYCSY